MQRRRIQGLAATGLVAAMTLTTLSACGDGGRGGVTLTMVAADYGTTSSDTSQKYWDDVVGAFEDENPDIRVDVKVYGWHEIDAKIAEMVQKGEAPDIAQGGAYADYAAQDMLYSADELLSVSTQADFIGSLATAGEVNRTQYGLPFVSSTRMLYYNKALFRQAGIAAPPTTWAELVQDARQLKSAGVKVPYGMPLGPEEAQAETMTWLIGNDGHFTDAVGTYTFDAEQNVETFKWLQKNLVDPGLAGEAPYNTNRQEVFDAFIEGEVGMVKGHSALLERAENKGLDVGVVPIPGRQEPLAKTLGVADWVMAFKEGGHREEIGTFLEAVYNQENSLTFLQRYDLLPVTNSASEHMLQDPQYADERKFIDQLASAEFYPFHKPSWGPVGARMKETVGKALFDPDNVLANLQIYAEAEDNAAVG